MAIPELKDLVLRYGTCLIDALQQQFCNESCLGFQDLIDENTILDVAGMVIILPQKESPKWFGTGY